MRLSLFDSLNESLLNPDSLKLALNKIVQNLNQIHDSDSVSSSLKCGINSEAPKIYSEISIENIAARFTQTIKEHSVPTPANT